MFTGEGEGELTIVVNLAKCVNYGRTVDERFIGMLSVVAHEVFHAAFGVYKDGSPVWRNYYATHRTPFDQLLDLSHNEGIAYYLTLIQSSRGKLPPDGLERARRSFADFNRNAAELLAPGTTFRRSEDIIRLSNTSGYWESYGAITGMIIARQIDQTLGREALVETIANGPADFFGKYAELMKRDGNIPSPDEHRDSERGEVIRLGVALRLPLLFRIFFRSFANSPSVLNLFVKNISQLVTVAARGKNAKTGAEMRDLGILTDAGVLCREGKIAWVGPMREWKDVIPADVSELDAAGMVLLPGFVDSHTHMMFAGSREKEFALRAEGATYQQIADAGGGILNTIVARPRRRQEIPQTADGQIHGRDDAERDNNRRDQIGVRA